MYGSSSGVPSTVTRPWSSQHSTVCPPTAITRLTRSSSAGGAMPTARPASSSAPVNQFDGGDAATSGSHVSGARNTTTSPGRGSPKPVRRLADQDPVTGAAGAPVQRSLHRPGGDEERLDEERLDEEGQHQRENQQDRQFAP